MKLDQHNVSGIGLSKQSKPKEDRVITRDLSINASCDNLIKSKQRVADQTDPKEAPVIIKNRTEFETALSEAMA